MKVEYLRSLQNIADNKQLCELNKAADYVFNAHEVEDQAEELREGNEDFIDLAYTWLHVGIRLGQKANGKRIFAVVGNEAVGESTFFFLGNNVKEVAAKLKKLSNNWISED